MSIFFFCLAGYAADESQMAEPAISLQYPVMGTNAEIKLYGNMESAKSAADAIRDELSSVEKTCSLFNPDSELSRLNATAAKEPFKCSSLLWEVLLESKKLYQLTDGSFDISVTPLMELWGFYRKSNALPTPAEIAEAKSHVGLDKVIFDLEQHTVKFPEAGMKLDLGGIAKGYAVDRAALATVSKGISCGTINLGGNIRCLKDPPPGKTKYTVGVRDPFGNSAICGTVQVAGASIATSGNYEKHVTINGVNYAHIMDPKTGEPVKGMISVTVVLPGDSGKDGICSHTAGDGLSTSVFIKGEDFARKICQQIPGASVLIIKTNPENPDKPLMIKIGDIWDDCKL